MPTLRVILADDHAIVREGLRAVLEKIGDVEVVGEADDGREAVELVRRLEPDIAIMDLSMPSLNGTDATRQIVDMGVGTRVIMMTMHADRHMVAETLKAGAMAYVLKNSAATELAEAVRAVMVGNVYLSPKVAGVVVENFVRRQPTDQGPKASLLTPREREVLQLLAEGRTSEEIAASVHVGVKTIETHRSQIMDKLGLRSIAELTKFAVREGLTPLE
jgi:DNA-binding NarL/FixJ family response regulator